jgi:hypothetical protein
VVSTVVPANALMHAHIFWSLLNDLAQNRRKRCILVKLHARTFVIE